MAHISEMKSSVTSPPLLWGFNKVAGPHPQSSNTAGSFFARSACASACLITATDSVSFLNAGYFFESLGGMDVVAVVVAHELNATRAGGNTGGGEIGAVARGLAPQDATCRLSSAMVICT